MAFSTLAENPRSLRILHCLRAPIGGLFRHVLDLAARQAALGHEVGIIADSDAEDPLTAPRFATLTPHLKLGLMRTPMRREPGVGDWIAWRSVLAHAKSLDLDILHGHGAKGGAYARLAARALRGAESRIRAFYTPHGGSLNYRPGTLPARALLALEKGLERLSDGLIFESAFAARTYADRAGAPAVPFRVIPNGLQPSDFAAVAPAADATDFLFIGELRPVKGVGYLLEALTNPPLAAATATIVGAGPSDRELRRKASGLGLANRVRFTGALPAREAFPMGRIMVVPSLAESFPYVVLEAAAAGLPLIATTAGGIPEIVAETDTSLVEPGNADALAAVMSAARQNPGIARARALRLKENVARKFTVAGMTDAVLDFYALRNP